MSDENGYTQQVTYNEDNDLLIYADKTNPDKISFTDKNGDYQEWEKDEHGNYVRTNEDINNTEEDDLISDDVTKTAINQIGSLIIANNSDFSKEELKVSLMNLLTKKCEICETKINKLQSLWNIYYLKAGIKLKCPKCNTKYKTYIS